MLLVFSSFLFWSLYFFRFPFYLHFLLLMHLFLILTAFVLYFVLPRLLDLHLCLVSRLIDRVGLVVHSGVHVLHILPSQCNMITNKEDGINLRIHSILLHLMVVIPLQGVALALVGSKGHLLVVGAMTSLVDMEDIQQVCLTRDPFLDILLANLAHRSR